MINLKSQLITKYEIKSKQCDVCGKTYDVEVDEFELQEFLDLNFVGGYMSVFGDGARVECDICQYCLEKMIRPYVRIKQE